MKYEHDLGIPIRGTFAKEGTQVSWRALSGYSQEPIHRDNLHVCQCTNIERNCRIPGGETTEEERKGGFNQKMSFFSAKLEQIFWLPDGNHGS